MEDKKLIVPEYDKLCELQSYYTHASEESKSIKKVRRINIELQHLSWLGAQVPKNGIIYELGSHQGKSTCAIGCGARYSGNNAELHCVDLWLKTDPFVKRNPFYTNEENWNLFLAQTASLDLHPVTHMMSTTDAAKEFKQSKQLRHGIDFLFIDANHGWGGPDRDYEEWWKFVRPGGYIAFHDYLTFHPAVNATVERAEASGMWQNYYICKRIWSAQRK
jgi:hypothetical protein